MNLTQVGIQRDEESISAETKALDGGRVETFEEAVELILDELREVLISKQADYGPGNIPDFGELGVLIRVNDKFKRLKNLLYDNPNEPSNESLDDTWVDTANYAIIALMVRRGIWGKPLEGRGKD